MSERPQAAGSNFSSDIRSGIGSTDFAEALVRLKV